MKLIIDKQMGSYQPLRRYTQEIFRNTILHYIQLLFEIEMPYNETKIHEISYDSELFNAVIVPEIFWIENHWWFRELLIWGLTAKYHV